MPQQSHDDLVSDSLPVVVAPDEIDINNAELLRADLLAATRDRAAVIVDLTRTISCDSRGVATLLEARRRARDKGGDLLLAGLQPLVQRILTALAVDQLFVIHATLSDALAGRKADPGKAGADSPLTTRSGPSELA